MAFVFGMRPQPTLPPHHTLPARRKAGAGAGQLAPDMRRGAGDFAHRLVQRQQVRVIRGTDDAAFHDRHVQFQGLRITKSLQFLAQCRQVILGNGTHLHAQQPLVGGYIVHAWRSHLDEGEARL